MTPSGGKISHLALLYSIRYGTKAGTESGWYTVGQHLPAELAVKTWVMILTLEDAGANGLCTKDHTKLAILREQIQEQQLPPFTGTTSLYPRPCCFIHRRFAHIIEMTEWG